MRGIATIDCQPNAETFAVWITGRSDNQVGHTNAVVIDTSDRRTASRQLVSLTRRCAVLLTDGSSPLGLPVEGEPLTPEDLEALHEEIAQHREAILGAVRDYRRTTSNSTLGEPVFRALPSLADFHVQEDIARYRAFALANFLRETWSQWLHSDEERRKRTVQPRTGRSPWVMPEHMNASTVPDFPVGFARRIHVQPLV